MGMESTIIVPTMDDVRNLVRKAAATGNQPRVHPNGFLQLDLDAEPHWHDSHKRGHSGADVRLHIWNPPGYPLPRQESVNEIHDHVFDMHSTVIRGVLQQKLYWFIVGDPATRTHALWRAVYGKGAESRLESLGVYGILRTYQLETVTGGSSYDQPAFTLHDSVPQGCVVTVMQKVQVHLGEATVVCPLDSEPDNSFDRANAADPDYLWEAIGAALT